MEILIGIIIGSIFIYLCLRPKLKSIQRIDEEIENRNKQIRIENDKLNNEYTLQSSKIAALESRKKELQDNIKNIEEQTEYLYSSNYELMQNKLQTASEKLKINFQNEEAEYVKEYLKTLEDSSKEFSKELAKKREELAAANEELEKTKTKINAVIEARKREEEMKLEMDKYRIVLMEEEINEIKRLKEIAPYFRNPRPIYKAIWESYYRTPCNELIERVVGNKACTGIYKITNLNNKMSYIGQATNLKERFKEHCKAGIGIDAICNKLYTAMQKDGVENFTFEVLEVCTRTELNEKETYWINYYSTQSYGYNMTRGGSAVRTHK